MSFEFHKNRELYFNQQFENAENYIIPFINSQLSLENNTSVLEIGCGEGGILKAFLQKGCVVTGIDLSENKIENANKFFSKEIKSGQANFICKDIYEIDFDKELNSKFDLIILKDTLEHIHNQEKLLEFIKVFLKPNGIIFLAFPAWQMPFGGHQQMCDNKFVSLMPYIHLFPNFIYTSILKLFGENENKIGVLLEIKDTGISIERFEKIIFNLKYKIENRLLYFINPNYKIKFNLKPRRLNGIISRIPYFRNFFTTTCYYLIKIK